MRAWLLVVAVSLLLVVVVVARRQDPLRRARLLKQAGLGVMAVVTALFGLVVAAEMFTDPGGWTALGLVAAWAVLLVILAAMAWYQPEGGDSPVRRADRRRDRRQRLVCRQPGRLAGVRGPARPHPSDHQPRLGRRGRPAEREADGGGGVLLLVLGVVPVVVSGLGSPLGLASLAVVSSAAVIAGVLYLSSAALTNPSVPPGGAQTLAAAWP